MHRDVQNFRIAGEIVPQPLQEINCLFWMIQIHGAANSRKPGAPLQIFVGDMGGRSRQHRQCVGAMTDFRKLDGLLNAG